MLTRFGDCLPSGVLDVEQRTLGNALPSRINRAANFFLTIASTFLFSGVRCSLANRVAYLLVFASSFQVTCASAIQPTDRFIPIGDLPGGEFSGLATAVSDDGGTVVGRSAVEGRSEVFVWTKETGTIGIGGVDTNYGSLAYSVSADGSVIAGSTRHTSDSYIEPFVYTSAIGFQPLTGCGCNTSGGRIVVSGDGKTVVGKRIVAGTGGLAYRWQAGSGPVTLGDLPGGNSGSDARDVSFDGSVVVGSSGGKNGTTGYRWTAETGMVPLGLPMAAAYAVSADGLAIAGVGFQNGQGAVRWSETEGSVWLGHIPGLDGNPATFASAISADGSVIVGGSAGDFGFEAFRWTEAAGMLSIKEILEDLGVDMTGWRLGSAWSVSGDGTVIVGGGINPAGHREGWVAVIPPTFVPEPPSATFLVLGMAALFHRYPSREPVQA